MQEWNVHKIRPSRNSNMPIGRPCIMFEMPELYQTKSYITEVPTFAYNVLESECKFLKYPCDQDFYCLCNIIMVENRLCHKDDPYEAIDLYIQLKGILKTMFN